MTKNPKSKKNKRFSKNLINNKDIIILCSKLKTPWLKKIIKHSGKDFIFAISEICDNVIKGNVPLSKYQFSRLKRYYKHLKLIANKKKSIALKKKHIQVGGFLPALITPLLGFLGSIISNIIIKKKQQ